VGKQMIYIKVIIGMIVLVLSIFLFSCQNPINTETDGYVVKDNIIFQIYQNYGYCDSTGCHTENVLLLSDMVIQGDGYSNNFITGVDSIWSYNQWIQYSDCYLIYNTTGEYSFNVELDNGENFDLIGESYVILNLNCNTTYNILIQ
jgi:hypothetical protein